MTEVEQRPMSWKRNLAFTAAALAVAAGLAYVLWPEPLAVDGAAVQTGPMQVTVDDQGETRSRDRFVVSAPVAGRLTRIALRDGDAVTRNQLLAEIAPVPLSLRERDETVARVAAAEAVQRESEQRVRRTESDLAQAQREDERVRKLVQDGFMSPQSAEQSRNAVVTAGAELEALRFRSRAAAADVTLARAGLGTTGGRVQVRAPMAGRILRMTDPSERVVQAGSPLLIMGDIQSLEIVVELLSSEAVKVAPGMPVLLDGWGGDKALRAKVRRVEPYAFTKVSALGIEEKRVNVVAEFVDPPGPIGDGFRVTARIVTWQADRVLKVPASALFRCEQAWCVFAVEAGRAQRRVVEIGHRNLVEAQVVNGLVQDQPVVLYPGNQVGDGVRVKVR
jgi:HlyD family secretion protein